MSARASWIATTAATLAALAMTGSADAAVARRSCGAIQQREVWVAKALSCRTARTVASAVLSRGRARGWACGRYATGEHFCSRGRKRPSYEAAELIISEPAESE